MNKNINAIDKIIAELSMKDFLRMNKKKDGTFYKKHRPYSLSCETLEALEIKKDYLQGVINENDYKAYCLKYNFRTL